MTSTAHPKPKLCLIVIGILAGIAILLYLNTFHAPWQFDDHPNIIENQSVHFHTFSLNRLLGLLVNSYSGSTRFLAYFTFALNFYFGRLNVFGYHLVNLLVHIATGSLIFWFIFLTLNLPSQREKYGSLGFKVAFLSSLFFIVHPVQTQAITYIVQRMTSMAAMFYLLSMILYIKGRISSGRRQILYYGGMGLSGLLSILSKETALMLPIFIVLYEVCFFRGEGRFFHGAMMKILLILGGLGWIGFILLGGRYINVIEEGYRYRDFTMSERVLTQLRVVLHYLTLLIYPHPSRLNLDYDFKISRSLFNPPTTLFSLIIIIFLIGMGIWRMKKWPVLSFFIFWYFGNLLIESSIIPLEMVYEHRLYLPSVGPIFLFCLLLVRGWEKWAPIEKSKREVVFAGLVIILIIFPLSWATIERNSIWRSEFVLWTDCVKKSPRKGRPHYNLGYYYYANGQVKKAIEEFELALELDPKMAPAHFNLGVIDYNEGRLDEAASRFKKALAIHPQYAQAYAYLGELYFRKGKSEEGLAEFKKALEMDSNNIKTLMEMGLIYLRNGDLEKALIDFKKVVMIDPNHIEALVNLGEIYIKKGMFDQALLEIRGAIKLKPDYGYAHTLLGIVCLQKGMMDEAISSFYQASKIDPNDVVALTNLGVAYRYKGMINEAISQFRRVLALRPEDDEAHTHLGEAYLAKNKVDEAIGESRRALQLNPNSFAARLVLGEAYLKQGKLDQAIAEWEKVLEVYPKEARAHNNLAAAYYAKKEYRLALKHLDEASALGFKVHPQLAERLRPYR